jgi:DNA replication and repair protein RecF
MHLARLRLRDFRNYTRLDAEFTPGFHLILGDNAQGKTNLLESIYLLATLRSFRGVGGAQIVRHGAKGYFIGATVIGQAEHEIRLYWSATERRVGLDGRPVRRLTDYLGVFRAVVFCSEDLLLIKGTGRVRRRFMDLLLSQTQPGYLAWLQRYARALRSRNALLRRAGPDDAALESFTRELIEAGNGIMRARRELVPQLAPFALDAHRRMAPETESFALDYRPQVKRDFAVELAQSRARERSHRMTVVGPHRDELEIHVDGRPASRYGSEGQKRTLALSLKMAQAEFLCRVHGVPPVLLMDDVMGELDLKRRSGLVPLLNTVGQGRGQVFLTCTEENWPRELSRDPQRWDVRKGILRPAS